MRSSTFFGKILWIAAKDFYPVVSFRNCRTSQIKIIDPFLSNAAFLYLLKTSKKMKKWNIGLKWIKEFSLRFSYIQRIKIILTRNIGKLSHFAKIGHWKISCACCNENNTNRDFRKVWSSDFSFKIWGIMLQKWSKGLIDIDN